MESKRKDIIECLRDWKASFKVTQNQTDIDKCLRELVGEGQLTWFAYSELNDFEDNAACKTEGFEAHKELVEVWTLKNTPEVKTSWEDIRKQIYKSFPKSFSEELGSITGNSDGVTKRNQLIEFIQKCEKCFVLTHDDAFVKLGNEAKKIDLTLNDWIQSKAHNEVGGFSHVAISGISDDFLKRIADAQTILPARPEPTYIIEPQIENPNTPWQKFYLENGLWIHLGVFLISSFVFYSLYYKEETFWILEVVLAIAVLNAMILAYFHFFYRERGGN